jgi:hypothetical protein
MAGKMEGVLLGYMRRNDGNAWIQWVDGDTVNDEFMLL